MAKKRGNGEGSVYRRKDGLWVGQYKIWTGNGTKTKYLYSKTRKDAATKLAEAIAERNIMIMFKLGYGSREMSMLRVNSKKRYPEAFEAFEKALEDL